MYHTRWNLITAVALLFFLAAGAACGDEENPADNTATPDAGQVDNDAQGAAECDEDEDYNPFTGECVPIEEEDDQDVGLPDVEEPDDDTDDNQNNGGDDCGFGSILGQACGTGGGHLPAATVSLVGVDCHGQPFQQTTSTNSSGVFDFANVPAGAHEMLVTSGTSFSSERDVVVIGGQETSLMSEAEKVCVDGDVNITIFNGSWDDVAEVLDNIDLTYDVVMSSTEGANLLSDPAWFATQDILFFECWFASSNMSGLRNAGDFDLMMNNLRNFIHQGGSVYTSDRTSAFIEELFPDLASFNCCGPTGSGVGEVVSAPMQALLGSSTIGLYFDTGWDYVTELNPPAVTHFQGPTPAGGVAPWMFSYTEPVNNGTVVFTSFHNSEGSTPDMMDVLEFLIFQL